MKTTRLVLCCVLLLLCSPFAFAQEGKRVALVIGNDSYTVKPLQNAVNDARLMSKALGAANFRVVMRENADKVAMEGAAAEFLQTIGPGDTALFFYAGHAVQIENENVLIPVDFQPSKNVIEARFKSFSLAMIFDYLKRSRAKTTIVIVDACRSNPVAEGNSLTAGLAIPLNAGKETYIAFSTSPNHVANDNPDGKNSWFTEALADQIMQEGLTLDEVFTRVRMRVEQATKGSQVPWSQTSLTTKFFFRAPKGVEAANDPSVAEKWLQEALKAEQRGDWQDAWDGLTRIVKQKPGGLVEQTAKDRLPYVAARREASEKFESGAYKESAGRFEEALKLDPFAFDAAEGAVRDYLLTEDFPAAVAALDVLRRRGTSALATKADKILKELAAVSPEAAGALQKGRPAPPPIQDLFTGIRFGTPDWAAAPRMVSRAAGPDLAQYAKLLPEPKAPPTPVLMVASSTPAPSPAQSTPAAANAPVPAPEAVTLDSLHVEITTVAASRDLVREEFGELNFKSGRGDTAVLMDGKSVTRQLPYRVKVPAGKYTVKIVEKGKIIGEQQVEVKPLESLELSIQ